MRALAGLLFTTLVLAQPAVAQAPAVPTVAVKALVSGAPASALFIGNSFFYYNNGIHSQVGNFVRAAGGRFRGTMATISGSGIDWHDVESYFRPNAVGRYSFRPDNSIVFNTLERLFDVAIVMDCSQCPVHPELKAVFHEHVKKNAEVIRRHKAEPVLFMSWAYADKPEMTAQLAEAYIKAANDNGLAVVPAGLAFARSNAKRPALNLYTEDKRHPSPAGTYLAAATTYATLFGKAPVGSSFKAGLDAETAAYLQGIAAETVAAFTAP